jgi:hypothetical protein
MWGIDRIALALEVPAAVITQYDDRLVLDFLKGNQSNEPSSKYLELLEKIVVLFEWVMQLEQKKIMKPA